MEDKLSKKIKELEKNINQVEKSVNEEQLLIESHKKNRADYQAQVNKFTALVGSEDASIKSALERLNNAYKQQLILESKLEAIKDFYKDITK